MYEVEVGSALKSLIEEVIALKKKDDIAGILSLLNKMTINPDDIIDAMPDFDCDEALLYVDDDVTAYYIATTPKILYPPHEHGMVAIIVLYKGTETQVFYDREGDNVVERSKVKFEAPSVIDMAADTVHAICTDDDEPNEGIHIYLGNLEVQKRTLWDISGYNPRQYETQDYLNSSRKFS